LHFNSLTFFLFLPAVYLCFLVVGAGRRWPLLLLASFVFYAAVGVPYLIAVFLLVTLAVFAGGLLINSRSSEKGKQTLLIASIAAVLLPLVLLRYLPVLVQGLHAVGPLAGMEFPRWAPVAIGVSYYVFQAVSYLVDVYLEKIPTERHVGYFALYLGFFPKMLQGPIERAEDLLPQLKAPYRFDYAAARTGLLLFAWGLFKKVVVANRLEGYVDLVYGDVHSYSGWALVLATWAYALQIYCDFSGYTHMALGSARLFNISLTDNFNKPYAASSVMDFWRRWHISFSRCLLDYLFKPLQMRFRDLRTAGTALALFLTFFISGLWHGASWCFVVWGLLHGTYLAAAVFWRPLQKKLAKKFALLRSAPARGWKVFFTFQLICFAWIFFRARTLADAGYVVAHLFAPSRGVSALLGLYENTGLFLALTSTLCVFIIESLGSRPSWQERFFGLPLWLRWSAYYLLILSLLLFNQDSQTAFIYMKF